MQTLVCLGALAVFVAVAAAFVLACGKVIDPAEQFLRVPVDAETNPRGYGGEAGR